MSYNQLLNNLGFNADPFAKTNADEEERLEECFIEPPFFKAVKGDVSTPKSLVVFAPMGSGKTALKRKIELEMINGNEPVLCLTYNRFNTQGLQLKDISESYHLENIIKLVLVGVLGIVEEDSVEKLTNDERHYIFLFTKKYLSEIDRSDLKNAVASITNISDKSKDRWNKVLGPVSFGINVILQGIG